MTKRINIFTISIVFICMLISACARFENGNNHNNFEEQISAVINTVKKGIISEKIGRICLAHSIYGNMSLE